MLNNPALRNGSKRFQPTNAVTSVRGRKAATAIWATLFAAVVAPAAPVAAEEAAPVKTSNVFAPSLAAELGAFLKAVLERPAAGRCEVLSPDPFYVNEMQVDVATLGRPEGPRYERRVALVVEAPLNLGPRGVDFS